MLFSGKFVGEDVVETDMLDYLRSCGLDVLFSIDSGYSTARTIASTEAINKIIEASVGKVPKDSTISDGDRPFNEELLRSGHGLSSCNG